MTIMIQVTRLLCYICTALLESWCSWPHCLSGKHNGSNNIFLKTTVHIILMAINTSIYLSSCDNKSLTECVFQHLVIILKGWLGWVCCAIWLDNGIGHTLFLYYYEGLLLL